LGGFKFARLFSSRIRNPKSTIRNSKSARLYWSRIRSYSFFSRNEYS
jgi:hypothetical protein